MDKLNTLCMVSTSGEEMTTRDGIVSGPGCQTTLRVSIDGEHQDSLRLEQLAYSRSSGWYTQKSFRIPRQLLKELLTELRKADCLMSCSRQDQDRPLRLVP